MNFDFAIEGLQQEAFLRAQLGDGCPQAARFEPETLARASAIAKLDFALTCDRQVSSRGQDQSCPVTCTGLQAVSGEHFACFDDIRHHGRANQSVVVSLSFDMNRDARIGRGSPRRTCDVPADPQGGLDLLYLFVHSRVGFAQAVGPKHFPGEQFGIAHQSQSGRGGEPNPRAPCGTATGQVEDFPLHGRNRGRSALVGASLVLLFWLFVGQQPRSRARVKMVCHVGSFQGARALARSASAAMRRCRSRRPRTSLDCVADTLAPTMAATSMRS